MNSPSDHTVTEARCNACGENLRAGEPFCTRCGEPVACRNCAQIFQVGDRFCPSCGMSKTTEFPAGEATQISSPWDLIVAKLRRATLGEFDIKGEIGRGGMAAVYLAHEVALDRKVAIKVMSPSLLMGQGMAQRFRQEAVTVANLNHQHIITIHAVRQFEDLQYFVMQFVEGCSLETIVKEAGPLPVPAVRVLLYHVGSALAHAHVQGVIHRDIKPGNILVDHTGQALVTDFGIAKVMESPSNTQTGMVVGTPAYMSPEQCHSGSVTWRSDQYALGIVAYEMLTGAGPFDGTTLSVIHAQVHDPVPPLLERRPDCPADLAQAVHRMLAKAPEERFGSMTEALQALGAMPLLPGDPIYQQVAGLVGAHESQASMPTTPVSPLMRRTPDGVATVVSKDRGPEAATTPIPASRDNTTPSRPVEKPKPTIIASPAPRRARRWPWIASLVVIAGVAGAVWFTRQRVPTLPPSTTPPPVAAVTVLPQATTLTVGDSVLLAVTVVDGAGGELAGADIEWRSSDSTVVTVGAGGEAVAAAVGTAYLVAGSGAQRDSARVTVTTQRDSVVSIAIAPVRQSLSPGKRSTLQATVVGSNGDELGGRPVRWASSDAAIATVDSVTGTLIALRPGRVEIRASVEGQSTVVALSINPAAVARVAVSPARLTLTVDSSATLQLRTEDADGRRLTGRTARWTSADPSIVDVASDGRVTAVAAGTTSISASVEGKSVLVPITVNAEPPVAAGLAIRDYQEVMEAGSRHDLVAVLTDQRGQPMTGNVAWASRNAAVVRVDATGQASAVAPGHTWLVAASANLIDSVPVRVAVPVARQIRQGVEAFLSGLNARDTDVTTPLLDVPEEDQRRLADKLLDKMGGGQWDLRSDTLPGQYATRIAADRAEATFTAEVAWKNAFGGRQREEVGFTALFTRSGVEWRLVEVRLGPETKL